MSLQDALKKAEVQHLKLKLNAQLQKNMDFFGGKDSEVYKIFSDYFPEKIQLILSDDGCLNLVNATQSNKYVYAYEPKKFCQDYMDSYLERPSFYKINLSKSRTLNSNDDIHLDTTNKAIELLAKQPYRMDVSCLEKSSGFFIIYGAGIGHIITELLSRTDVRNLVVVEPDLDVFHSSLHIVDWESIYARFDKPYHSFKLILGKTALQSVEELRKHLNYIGIFNAAHTFVIDHLSSKEIKAVSTEFFQGLARYVSSAGFFDDEQWSLAHTLENWCNHIPPLRKHSILEDEVNEYPVFLIANGPSLDSAKKFLIENREKAIYVSCGSTLGSLKAMGIKPDFHIEMERRLVTYEVLSESTDEEYRDGIRLLALNTVHPDVFGLFKKKGMALKANDLGTHFFSRFIPNDEYCINLSYCNPNVSNAGLAFVSAIGASSVYMFGVDLAIGADDQHHSSYSPYSKYKKEVADEVKAAFKQASDKTVPANFGGTVQTRTLFLAAISSLETVIRQNRKLKYFNASNGALIKGSVPIHKEDIDLPPIKNREAVCDSLFENSFYGRGLMQINSKEEFDGFFSTAISFFNEIEAEFKKEQDDWDDAYMLLSEQQRYVLMLAFDKENQYIYTLLKGSLSTWAMLLNYALYKGNTRSESLVIFKSVKDYYLEFISRAKGKLRNSMVRIDKQEMNFKSYLK